MCLGWRVGDDLLPSFAHTRAEGHPLYHQFCWNSKHDPFGAVTAAQGAQVRPSGHLLGDSVDPGGGADDFRPGRNTMGRTGGVPELHRRRDIGLAARWHGFHVNKYRRRPVECLQSVGCRSKKGGTDFYLLATSSQATPVWRQKKKRHGAARSAGVSRSELRPSHRLAGPHRTRSMRRPQGATP